MCQPLAMARGLLSERAARLRLEKHVSQSEAADAIGISRTFLAGIETNKDMPGRETLIAMADYYGVSVDWLSTGEGDPSPTALQRRTAGLIEIFESLDPHDKDALESLAHSLARRPR